MSIVEGIMLGIVQGLTEFLPVSSSGHLILAKDLLGIDAPAGLAFEASLHLATLVSVLWVLRTEVRLLIIASPDLLRPRIWSERFASSAGFRQLVLVGIATVPIVSVGLIWKDDVASLYRASRVAIFMLITAAILVATRFMKDRTPPTSIGWKVAFIIGIAQAFAVLPGISRSGSTIAVALACGVSKKDSGAFAFLISIPAICGATILTMVDAGSLLVQPGPLLCGFLAAALSGAIALRCLLWILRDGLLWVFAPYLVLLVVLWWI